MGMLICKKGEAPVSGMVLGEFTVAFAMYGGPVKKKSRWTMCLTPEAFVFAGTDSTRAYIPYERMVNFEIKDRIPPLTNSVMRAYMGTPYKTIIEFAFIGNTEQLEVFRFETASSIVVSKNQQECERLLYTMKANGIFDKFQKSNSGTPSSENDILGQIEKLGELHKSGILTDEEFATKKAELLKKL